MVDVAGTWLTAEDRQLLRQPEVGGLCIGCYTYIDGQALRRWSHPLDYLTWVTLLPEAADKPVTT